jgi:hypothetical protein
MNSELRNRTMGALLVVILALAAPLVHAGKPDRSGSGTGTESVAAGAPPEFFWASFDPVNRQLTLQGKELLTGDAVTPVLPQITIGGELVEIDVASSVGSTDFSTNQGAVIIGFASILDSLAESVPAPGLRVLQGGDNWEIKAVTATGTAQLSAYFPDTLKELPADYGNCPCAADYAALYRAEDAAAGALFCSASQGISTDDYIEAGYGKPDGTAVIIGSHRSWSSESLYTSTCYVRDLSQVVNGIEEPRYLAPPQPVGNADHLLCVDQIKLLEAACGL